MFTEKNKLEIQNHAKHITLHTAIFNINVPLF